MDNLADAESLTAIEKEEDEDDEAIEIDNTDDFEEERKRKLRKLRKKRRKRKLELERENQENGDIRLQTLNGERDDKKSEISKSTSDDSEYDDEDFDEDEIDDDIDDESEVDELEIDANDKENKHGFHESANIKSLSEYSGARPRRLSEINITKKIPPIPKYSSFFIFSHTNRYKY